MVIYTAFGVLETVTVARVAVYYRIFRLLIESGTIERGIPRLIQR
jgi:hypothetical protein